MKTFIAILLILCSIVMRWGIYFLPHPGKSWAVIVTQKCQDNMDADHKQIMHILHILACAKMHVKLIPPIIKGLRLV